MTRSDQPRSSGSPEPAPKPLRSRVPLWTETACRFRPKPPAGLNRNRLPETPKFADHAHTVIESAVLPPERENPGGGNTGVSEGGRSWGFGGLVIVLLNRTARHGQLFQVRDLRSLAAL